MKQNLNNKEDFDCLINQRYHPLEGSLGHGITSLQPKKKTTTNTRGRSKRSLTLNDYPVAPGGASKSKQFGDSRNRRVTAAPLQYAPKPIAHMKPLHMFRKMESKRSSECPDMMESIIVDRKKEISQI